MLIAIVTSLGYRMPATLAEWGHFAFFSTFNTLIPFALIVWGQSRATGGMAAILNSSAPLFGIFLAHLLTHDEKLSAQQAGRHRAGHGGGRHPGRLRLCGHVQRPT